MDRQARKAIREEQRRKEKKYLRGFLRRIEGGSSLEQLEEESEFVVTEENFHQAYNKAGPLARKRLNKKMEKKKMRGGTWAFTKQPVPGSSPFARRLGYLRKDYLPCADLEQYVKRFVLVHMNKGIV